MNRLTIAQISDSHLYAQQDALHHGYNVLSNLKAVLRQLSQRADLAAIIFTGDLSQDHSIESYQHFNQAVIEANLSCSLYYLAGNHDDIELLNSQLTAVNISPDKVISFKHWQLLLTDSKSLTPAGFVSAASLKELSLQTQSNVNSIVFMHHHPIDVGYFIDRHGLQNQQQFWHTINAIDSIKAVCCGHVHRGQDWPIGELNKKIVYCCPATSIQFDPQADTVAALEQGAGYRLLHLSANGACTSEIIYLETDNQTFG